MVDLKDFISDAIVDLCEGLSDAKERLKDKGAYVNPPVQGMAEAKGRTVYTHAHGSGHQCALVDFDIAITASQKTAAEGGGRVSVVGVSFGSEVNGESASSTVSHVKFTLPIAFPNTGWDDIK